MIGIVGLGVVGSANKFMFQKLGHKVLEHDIKLNTHLNDLLECSTIYIAVPTSSKSNGDCDTSIVEDVVNHYIEKRYYGIIGIKSTVKPGITDKLIKINGGPKVINPSICFIPELLREKNPIVDCVELNKILVVGTYQQHIYDKIVEDHGTYPQKRVMMTPIEAELFKYLHNVHGFVEVILMNLCYDLADKLGVRWEVLKEAMIADPMFSNYYREPIHKSGRGAGGHCFIKDFATFRDLHSSLVEADEHGQQILASLEAKNIELLKKSGKDLDLLNGVYGSIDKKSD